MGAALIKVDIKTGPLQRGVDIPVVRFNINIV